jgi:putative PIN family toxin of toxin-antitoxin system
MRAVLDTNVLISGLLWRGAPHSRLLAAEAGLFELVLAESILAELRDKLVTKFHHTAEDAGEEVSRVRKCARLVEITDQHGWVPADLDDDRFVETAIAARAEFIVSGDRHLQTIGSVDGVEVLSPRQFLERITTTAAE